MSRAEPGGGIDDRLRQLLEIEQRLQALVREAEERAAARVAQARADAERLRAAAGSQHSRRAEGQALSDRVAHEQALLAVAVETQAALQSLSSLSADRIDELARLALDRAIGGERGTP